MRSALILVTLLAWCFLARDTGGKPIDKAGTVMDVVTQALDGSDKEKAEALYLVLELLAETDLPSFCQALTGTSKHFTKVDDIIALAATRYGIKSSSAGHKKKDRLTSEFIPERSSLADITTIAYRSSGNVDNEFFGQNLQILSAKNPPISAEKFGYFNQIRPIPGGYPDSHFNPLPSKKRYDFYDVNDSLVYNLTGSSSLESDVIKTADEQNNKTRTPLLHHGDPLVSSTLPEEDKENIDQVIIDSSQSTKRNYTLSAESFRMGVADDDDDIGLMSGDFDNMLFTTDGYDSSMESQDEDAETHSGRISSHDSAEQLFPSNTTTLSYRPDSNTSTDSSGLVIPKETSPSMISKITTTASSSSRPPMRTDKISVGLMHKSINKDRTTVKQTSIRNINENITNQETGLGAEVFHSINVDMHSSNTGKGLNSYSANNKTTINGTSDYIQVGTNLTPWSTTSSTPVPEFDASTLLPQDLVSAVIDKELYVSNSSEMKRKDLNFIMPTQNSVGNKLSATSLSVVISSGSSSPAENELADKEYLLSSNSYSLQDIVDTRLKTVPTLVPVTVTERTGISTSDMSASAALNTPSNMSTVLQTVNNTVSPNFAETKHIKLITDNHNEAPAVTRITQRSNISADEDETDMVSSLSFTAMHANTTWNVYSMDTDRNTTSTSFATTEANATPSIFLRIKQAEKALEGLKANTISRSSIQATAATTTKNTFTEEAETITRVNTFPTDPFLSIIVKSMERNTLSSNSKPIQLGSVAISDAGMRLIPNENWTTNMSEDRKGTGIPTSGSATLITPEFTTVGINSADSSESSKQTSASVRERGRFHASEPEPPPSKNAVSDTDKTSMRTSASKPDLRRQQPSYRSAHPMEQRRVKQVKSTAGSDSKEKVVSAQPLSLWPGRQGQYPSSQALEGVEAATLPNTELFKRWYDKKLWHNTYTADHVPSYGQNYVKTTYSREKADGMKKRAFLSSSATNSKAGEAGSLKPWPNIHSRSYPPFSQAPSSANWSPFRSHFPLPNLGTLWGGDPDSRMPSSHQGLLAYRKRNSNQASSSTHHFNHLDLEDHQSAGDDYENGSDQTEISNEVKVGSSKVKDEGLAHSRQEEKDGWSEVATYDGLQPLYSGYACPGLFGFFGDIMDCRSFFICSWGVPYRFYCPSGTLWNPSRSVCDWSRDVLCPN